MEGEVSVRQVRRMFQTDGKKLLRQQAEIDMNNLLW